MEYNIYFILYNSALLIIKYQIKALNRPDATASNDRIYNLTHNIKNHNHKYNFKYLYSFIINNLFDYFI